MKSFKYVISVKQGLHAKNAMELSRAASYYESRITLIRGDHGPVDCKNVLALMSRPPGRFACVGGPGAGRGSRHRIPERISPGNSVTARSEWEIS